MNISAATSSTWLLSKHVAQVWFVTEFFVLSWRYLVSCKGLFLIPKAAQAIAGMVHSHAVASWS